VDKDETHPHSSALDPHSPRPPALTRIFDMKEYCRLPTQWLAFNVFNPPYIASRPAEMETGALPINSRTLSKLGRDERVLQAF